MKKILSVTLVASIICSQASAQLSVTTLRYDQARSSWNNREVILNPSNVNARQFGKLFSVPVDGDVYAQVLIQCNVNVAGGIHNVAITATTLQTVYAFDADNGNMFWTKNFTAPGMRTVRNTDFGSHCKNGQKDYSRDLGIVATPVIDSNTQTLYFVTRSTDADSNGNGNYYTHLHAVDISTGLEKPNSPALITGSVPGTGSDAVNGIVTFNPWHQNGRIGLALYNGTVFIAFGSGQCDWRPYHGWIFGYDATSLQRKYIYNTTPKAMGGGIWESGGGIAIDDQGFLYVVSGNGFENSMGYNGNPSDLINRAQSAIKLQATNIQGRDTLIPVDFFTPANGDVLNEGADLDNGSMAPFLIPNTNVYVTGCKDGNLYILNTNNLGGFHPSGDQVIQTIKLGTGVLLRCHPAYYGSANHDFIYVWSQFSQLKAIPFDRTTNKFDLSELKTGLVTADPLSSNISTSSNNSQDGTGIVWINQIINVGQKLQRLTALDANDITKELWNSDQNGPRDYCGNFMKFGVPTVANGKVYLANGSLAINVFGIIDPTQPLPNCLGSTVLSLNESASASSFTDNGHSPSKAFDQIASTAWNSTSGTPQLIAVDLGAKDSICNITLQWGNTASGKDFLLQVSDDSTNWTTVQSISANSDTINSFNVNTAGRYVRMYGTTSNSPNGFTLEEFTVYGSVIQSCKPPTGLTVNMIDTVSAVIRWNSTQANSYTVNFKAKSTSTWQTFSTTRDTMLMKNLSCNNYYQYAVQSHCGTDISSFTQTGEFNTLGCNNCILPTRVNQTDIGDVGVPGQGCYTKPNNYNINGSGADIGGTADGLHFVYYDFSGDADLISKVAGMDDVSPSNKAGIMIRESVDANSRSVFLGLTSGGQLVFLNRQNTGGNTITVANQQGYAPPYYLKILKRGTEFLGYVSTDNTNWTLIGTTINQMTSDGIHGGLAVTSHDNQSLSNAKFNGLTVNAYLCGPLPKKVFSQDVGVVGVPGNVCYYTYNRYVVNGSGNSITGKTDAFYYVYKSFSGNQTITAKVTSQDQSNLSNKAGIMIRWALTASQTNIFVGLTSANGAFFQYRNGSNKITQTTLTGSYKAPYFIRLVKSNESTYSGYISPDSINWQKIGETVIQPGSKTSFKAGLAVSSNDGTTLSNVIFDGWTMQTTVTQGANLFADNIGAEGDNFKIYPNPAKGSFTVDCEIPQKQDILISIIGAGDGRIYFTQSLTNFSGRYHKEFTEFILPKGSYIVSLRTPSGKKSRLLRKD